jgi:ABC-2 type transport system permease protein
MINRNIYVKELKQNRNSFIIWGISLTCLIFLGMLFYPVLMEGDMLRQMKALFENPFMKNMMAAFGANLDSLASPLGFYSTRNAVFISLLGGFFAIILAGKILAQEEHEGTADFLLTKPVSRMEVALSKLAAFLTYLGLLNIIILIFGFTSLELFKGDAGYSLPAFLVHTLYGFLLMLTFGAVGFFLALLIKRGRPITGISIGIIVGSYFFDFLSKITPSADAIGYISPFKFLDSGVLNPGYGLTWWRVLYFLGLSLILYTAALIRYRKKDIFV